MASSFTGEQIYTQSSSDMRLHGLRLVVARLLWAGLVIGCLGLFIAMLPAYFIQLQTVCTGPLCALGQPSHESIQTLQAHGLTVGDYAGFVLVLTILVSLLCVVVFLLLTWRKSDDRIVLLVTLTLVMEGTTFVTYTLEMSHSVWRIPAFLLSTLSWSTIFLLFALFPDGRFVPRWTRWLVIVWVGFSLLSFYFPIVASSPLLSDGIWLCLCTCGVAAQVYRYRYVSGPVQRQQTRWIVYGTSLGTVAVIVLELPLLFFPALGPGSLYNLFAWCGFILSLFPFPLSVAFAVQRSRLWDLDNIINRTIVYGLLTAVLAVIYFVCVVFLQFLFRALTGQDSPFAIVVSTVIITLLFRPLQTSIQTTIDSCFFRRHYDIAKVLAGFDDTMRSHLYSSDQETLEKLTHAVLETVGRTLEPQHKSLWVYDLDVPEDTAENVPRTTSSLLALQTTSDPPIASPNPSPVSIAQWDPLKAIFLSATGAVDIARVQAHSPALECLKRAGMKLCVPLVSQGELVGLLSLGPRLSEQDYSSKDHQLLSRLATQAAPAIRVAQFARRQEAQARERERIEEELRVARLIQHAFLPKELPTLPDWHVAAYYQPARMVGGDFYDFISFEDGRLGIVIGDVTDKGVPAALLMTTTRSILRSVARSEMSPGKVLEETNNLLYPDMPPKMFVTCLYAILDPLSGTLRYANAGHDAPYQRKGDAVSELWATGMPLGLMPDMTYEEKECVLAYGDSVLFYSDGLVEAHNPEQVMYGFPRLGRLLEERRDDPDLIHLLLRQLEMFTGPAWEQEDDITLVTLHRVPALVPSTALQMEMT